MASKESIADVHIHAENYFPIWKHFFSFRDWTDYVAFVSVQCAFFQSILLLLQAVLNSLQDSIYPIVWLPRLSEIAYWQVNLGKHFF